MPRISFCRFHPRFHFTRGTALRRRQFRPASAVKVSPLSDPRSASHRCCARIEARRLSARAGGIMDIGLIGLGRMGAGIAKALLRSSHQLTVYNRTRARVEALAKEGAKVALSIADACQADVLLTM